MIPCHEFSGKLAGLKDGWSLLQILVHCCISTSTPQTQAHSQRCQFVQPYAKPTFWNCPIFSKLSKKCFLTELLCSSKLERGHANRWISTAQGWIAMNGEQNRATGGPATEGISSSAEGLVESNHILGGSWLIEKTSKHPSSLGLDWSQALHFSSAYQKNCMCP